MIVTQNVDNYFDLRENTIKFFEIILLCYVQSTKQQLISKQYKEKDLKC